MKINKYDIRYMGLLIVGFFSAKLYSVEGWIWLVGAVGLGSVFYWCYCLGQQKATEKLRKLLKDQPEKE